MTPEREAQMREMYIKEFGERPNSAGSYREQDDADEWDVRLSGFLACARALEPMVMDSELYRWLLSQYFAVDFDYDGECVLVFKIPQNTRVSADCDATIKAAMSAALEDGNATE